MELSPEYSSAGDPTPVPDGVRPDLNHVRSAATVCTACPLFRHATQTVFGEGPARARIMIVGEQPGDREDRYGRPFVGPAGLLLDRALVDAGIDRAVAYVTNAVKHFKRQPQGKRRLHQKPSPREIAACRPWLEAELSLVRPSVVICLGSTAAASIVGPKARVLRDRGRFFESPYCSHTLITVHPSSLLRAGSARDQQYGDFVSDLAVAASRLRETDGPASSLR